MFGKFVGGGINRVAVEVLITVKPAKNRHPGESLKWFFGDKSVRLLHARSY